jgi:glycerol-3-phosphate dehydrogenase
MKRDKVLDRIENAKEPWDFLVIGGGATGLGVAVDAAARGYSTLVVEQYDFSKGTSSRSTKLVHGGVRYLKQGNISLVLEALRERGLLTENAPHLVHPLAFIVPIYSWWEGPFYGIGMTIYDRLAGKLGLKPSESLSREETLKRIPTLEATGLQGGVSYYDGQFDDSRLAVNLAQTIIDLGGAAANYLSVVSLIKEAGLVVGVVVHDSESGKQHTVRARVVVNATGVFCDSVRKMDEPDAKTIIAPSQGAHLVLPKAFLPGDSAIMVPQTSDGRVLFAVPWHDCVVVGTTDTSVDHIDVEPRPMEEEIGFILTNASKYLSKRPNRNDVLSVFAGLRPLVKVGDAKSTAALSRDHTILISNSGLLTIAGGKWPKMRSLRLKLWPASKNAHARPSICRFTAGPSRVFPSQPCVFTVPTHPRSERSLRQILNWGKKFTPNCRILAPKWYGLCAKKWREQSRTCSRGELVLCSSVPGQALRLRRA